MPSCMLRCPSFFLFHGRALKLQPIRRKVRRTRQIVPRACRAKRFGPRTQLQRSSSNCPNQVREGKVRPKQNELGSPKGLFFFMFFSGFAELSEPDSRRKSSPSSQRATHTFCCLFACRLFSLVHDCRISTLFFSFFFFVACTDLHVR